MKNKNSVMCLQCGETLVSVHRWDFVQCHCSNQTFTDGGDDYQRYGGVDMGKIEVLGRKTMKKTRKMKKRTATVTASNAPVKGQIVWLDEKPRETFLTKFLRLLTGA